METLELANVKPVVFREKEPAQLQAALLHRISGAARGKSGGYPIIKTYLKPASVYHTGLLDYLSIAWANHFGVVFRPDFLWYTILAELTSYIGNNPDPFKELFTTTPDKKQEIWVMTADVTELPLTSVVEELKSRVPTDVDLFLPVFSTTTGDSHGAAMCAFADMVSPWYSYGTFLCGFPVIRIEGERVDWQLIHGNLVEMQKVFREKNTARYVHKAKTQAAKILDNFDKPEFWKKMVKVERCGSGSQYEMSGWLFNFLMKTSPGTQLEGLPPHISIVDYKNKETKREFQMSAGLFSSKVDDIFLVPDYGFVIAERTERKVDPKTAILDSLESLS